MADSRKLSALSGALRGVVEGVQSNRRDRLLQQDQQLRSDRSKLAEKEFEFSKETQTKRLDQSERRLQLNEGSFAQTLRKFEQAENEKKLERQKNEELVQNLETVQQSKTLSQLKRGMADPEVRNSPEFLTELEQFRQQMKLDGITVRRESIDSNNPDSDEMLLLVDQDGVPILDEEIMVEAQKAKNAAIVDGLNRADNPQVTEMLRQVFGAQEADPRSQEVVDVRNIPGATRVVRRDGTVEDVKIDKQEGEFFIDKETGEDDRVIRLVKDENGNVIQGEEVEIKQLTVGEASEVAQEAKKKGSSLLQKIKDFFSGSEDKKPPSKSNSNLSESIKKSLGK